MNAILLLPLVALIVMYISMARTQKKQQQQRQSSLDAMKPGDKVVTAGGLHGVLAEIDSTKSTVTIDCEGIFLEFDRTSIRTVKPMPAATESEVVDETIIDETTAPEEPENKE